LTRPIYSQVKLDRRPSGHQNRSGSGGEEKNVDLRFPGCPASSLVTVLIGLPWFYFKVGLNIIIVSDTSVI
jgi:hypothetical protein